MKNSSLKYFFATVVVIVSAIGMASCSTDDSKLREQEIQAAREAAIKAAEMIVTTDHANLVALERAILEAKAQEGEYWAAGDSLAARAFDEELRAYILQNDPPLAEELMGTGIDPNQQ